MQVNNNNIEDNPFKGGFSTPIVVGVIVGAIALFSLLDAFTIIRAGERGVVLRFGAVQDGILHEGLHLKTPYADKIAKIDVKIRKAESSSQASTKDLQDTLFTIALNYHPNPLHVNTLYQEIGVNYKGRVIDPAVNEVVKAIAAQYTAEELIVKRSKVSREIKVLLETRLSKYNIIVDEFSIVNFRFSEQFTTAIEEKQTAEQKALKAERDLERIKFEAKQRIEEARAEAQALKLKRAQITDQLIRLKQVEAQVQAIEKWDGKLPRVNSEAVPFIQLKE